MTADHVVWDNGKPREPLTLAVNEQMVFACRHCGDRYVLPVPCSVAMVAVVARQYGKEHRRCKKAPP